MKKLFFAAIISLLFITTGNSKELKQVVETCLGEVNLSGVSGRKGTFRDPKLMVDQETRPLESSLNFRFLHCSCRFLFKANSEEKLDFAINKFIKNNLQYHIDKIEKLVHFEDEYAAKVSLSVDREKVLVQRYADKMRKSSPEYIPY